VTGTSAKLKDLSAREEQRRLSKEELLRPRIIRRTEFIESLGGEIVLQSLSHRQRQELHERAHVGKPDFDDDLLNSLTVVASIVDPKLEESDIEALREQDVTVYDEIVLKITMLNMLGRTDDLKKDSKGTLNSDSPSD
jgi:hypothetical protein